MRWAPSNLPAPFLDFARALEKHFAPRLPDHPVRQKAFAEVDLTDALAERNPHSMAINTDTGALVVAVLVGGAWKWRQYDGGAL